MWADALLCLYYINNPITYSLFLINLKQIVKEDDYDHFNETDKELINLVSNITLFEEKLNNKEVTSKQVYSYSVYHSKNGGSKSYRLFINNLIFGFFQMLASIFAFNVRRPHHNWKKDMIVLIIVKWF